MSKAEDRRIANNLRLYTKLSAQLVASGTEKRAAGKLAMRYICSCTVKDVIGALHTLEAGHQLTISKPDYIVHIFKDGGYCIEKPNNNPGDRISCMVAYAMEEWDTEQAVKPYRSMGQQRAVIVDHRQPE